MARKKLKLAFLSNNTKRKASFKKRKCGFLKKIQELATLCGVKAMAIIYSEYEAEPIVWPNIPEAQRVIAAFNSMPKFLQIQKMVNQEKFINQMIRKAKEQMQKQIKKNKERELKEVMYRCLIGAGVENFDKGELNHLGRVVDDNIKEISKRIEKLTIGEGSKDVAAPRHA